MKILAGVLVLGSVYPGAHAQDYGLDFVTIGDPGNRDTTPEEQILSYGDYSGIGAVDYEFRITRSPLTATQWLEFVNAYAPFWEGLGNSPQLSGVNVRREMLTGGGYEYAPYSGEEHAVNGVTWHLAASYANWLHNGKRNEASAFETGAYDLSGFDATDPNSWTPPLTRNPGAKFWIPTLDEFAKAAYYDPNRYEPGQEGYWLYPDQGNEPLIEGLPEDGGETIGFLASIPDWTNGVWPVGQYPHVRSHYGLLDVSGTKRQWLEDQQLGSSPDWRLIYGTASGDVTPASNDRLDSYRGTLISGYNGLRLASVVPSVPTVLVLIVPFGLNWVPWSRSSLNTNRDLEQSIALI